MTQRSTRYFAAKERARLAEIGTFRRRVRNPEHRFLLAVLLNVPNREDVLRLVGERAPGAEPADTLNRWVEELGTRGKFRAYLE
jgi:methyl coenzyme M reductase gamma subunit